MINMTMKRIIHSSYKYIVFGGVVVSSGYGVIQGVDMASQTTFNKKNLTIAEYIGETVCYSGIVTVSTIFNGVFGGLYIAAFPITLPITYYMMK